MGKINLHLAKPSSKELAALYKKLTGKTLSPEGRASIEATLEKTIRPERTPAEQRFLVQMERLRGRPLTVYEENLSIEQCLALNGTLDWGSPLGLTVRPSPRSRAPARPSGGSGSHIDLYFSTK